MIERDDGRIERQITFFTSEDRLVCDAKCHKAWGLNCRPKIEFVGDDDPDDYAFYADHELAAAPADPGTYEGGHAKPTAYGEDWKSHRLNKWCARECERSWIISPKYDEKPKDFSKRRYNIPSFHPEAE